MTKSPKQRDLFSSSEADQLPKRVVRCKRSFRLQSVRHPPIKYFERIANREDASVLESLERLTNSRARQTAGRISLIPLEKRVFGPGASFIMGPFVYFSPDYPSRFSDGTYGVYYAARYFETALREVAYHRGLFHSKTKDRATRTSFRTVTAALGKALHDLRGEGFDRFLHQDPARYAAPQVLSATLRNKGSNGIVYPSVRHDGGECFALFWPNLLSEPREGKRITLRWDGTKIVSWFDHETNEWTDF